MLVLQGAKTEKQTNDKARRMAEYSTVFLNWLLMNVRMVTEAPVFDLMFFSLFLKSFVHFSGIFLSSQWNNGSPPLII